MKVKDYLNDYTEVMANMLINLMINGYDPKTMLKDAEQNCPMLVEALKITAEDFNTFWGEVKSQFNSSKIGIFGEPDQTDENGNLMFPAAFSAEILKQTK